MRSSVLVVLALALPAAPGMAQGAGTGSGLRLGVTLGGISRYGLVVEYFEDAWGVDVTLGTWRFADLSVSAVAKRYFRDATPHPYAGAGLWIVTVRPSEGRRGLVGVLRVPLGVDWRFTGSHHVGGAVNLNRALFVRRPNPRDDVPLVGRIVPLPGLYYRFSFR